MVFSATSGFGVDLVGHRPPQGSVPSWLPGVSGRPSCVSVFVSLLFHSLHVLRKSMQKLKVHILIFSTFQMYTLFEFGEV